MPPEPDTAVILECDYDGTWTHRYGTVPDDYAYCGRTVCCERPVYKQARTLPWSADVLIDDCCDKPGIPKPVVLPPYSGEHATCRKCGSKAVETVYMIPAEHPSYGGFPRRGYPREWLARRCTVCQAKWDEACVAAANA